MNKFLLLALCILLFAGTASSQVFIDFELEALGTNNFADNGWATGLDDVVRISDPTGRSAGVLAVAMNPDAGTSGVIENGVQLDMMGAEVLSYMIWVPAEFPDSASVVCWAQDNATWSGFPSSTYYGIDLPKETWITINFDVKELDVSEGAGFEPYTPNKLGKYGIQFNFDETFDGEFYIDDIALVGAEPNVISDFEIEALGTDNFAIGWGDASVSLERAADPSGVSDGVMAFTVDGSLGDKKAAFERTSVAPDGAHLLVFDVYLPEDFPDDVYMQVFGQDDDGWEWASTGYNSADIPKGVWYPLNFDLLSKNLGDPTIDPYTNNMFGKIGMEALFGETAFSGTFYIDNARLIGTDVGAKWVIADFEIAALELNGWDSGWGEAKVSSARIADPTGKGGYVMEMVCNGGNGDRKAAFANEQVVVVVEEETATALSLDIYLPADLPGDTYIQIFGQDRVTWGWQADGQNASSLKLGAWNTLTFDIATRVAEVADYDVSQGLKCGVELLFPEGSTFTGSVYVDDITLYGVEEVIGELQSPTLLGVAQNSVQKLSGGILYINNITWLDLNRSGESYNLYVSETAPITDTAANGVVLLAADIGEDIGYFNHRVLSADGAEKTYYYALTCTGLDEEQKVIETPVLDGVSNSGAITGPSTVMNQIPLVSNFDFEIDGDIDEFQELAETFPLSKLLPETGFEVAFDAGWDMSSEDLNFEAYFVMDAENLYIGAAVVDNDPTGPGDPWEGDGLDMYFGLYDVTNLTEWHSKSTLSDADKGDYRVSYAVNKDTKFTRNGGTAWDLEGEEDDIDILDDGYIVEIKIPLASLNEGLAFTPTSGAVLPFKFWVNDYDVDDPLWESGDNRTLVLAHGSTDEENNEAWLRPETWGKILVTSDPTVKVADTPKTLPKETKLFANYPNPFNPSTRISYRMAEKAQVKLIVYDVMGREIRTLLDKSQDVGLHSIEWDGKDGSGMSVSSGMYFIKMVTNNYQNVQKMMLIK